MNVEQTKPCVFKKLGELLAPRDGEVTLVVITDKLGRAAITINVREILDSLIGPAALANQIKPLIDMVHGINATDVDFEAIDQVLECCQDSDKGGDEDADREGLPEV